MSALDRTRRADEMPGWLRDAMGKDMPAWLRAALRGGGTGGRQAGAAGPRTWYGALDTRRMLAEGLAAVEAIERDRERKYNRHRAAREAGMALYGRVRRQHGYPPSAPRPLAAYLAQPGAVIGAIPPDPAQVRTVVF